MAREVCGGSPRDSKATTNVKIEGCIQSKYDDYKQSDVLKASLNVDAVPLYPDAQACELIQIKDADSNYVDGEDIYEIVNPATVNDWMRDFRMKEMDILVSVDQCCVKKTGRDLLLMPKFKIRQAVVKTQNNERGQKRHVGLRLIRQ